MNSIKTLFNIWGEEEEEENTVRISESKIRNIINEIKSRRRNVPFEYLILLSDEYFYRRYILFSSYANKIRRKRYSLPGKLRVIKYSNMDINLFNQFEDNPIPNEIYIKLPKEKLYVLYEDFSFKYLYSQIQEFYDILSILGAESIILKRTTNESLINNLGMSIGTNSTPIKINQAAEVKNEMENITQLFQEMKFLVNNTPNIDKFLDLKRFYYLSKKTDWQSLIIRRIEKNQIKDKFIFYYSNRKLLSTKFVSYLQKLNVSYESKFEVINNIKIEYDIDYKQIKNYEFNYINNDNLKNENLRNVSNVSNASNENASNENASNASNAININSINEENFLSNLFSRKYF